MGYMSNEMKKTTFIHLSKKPNAVNCIDFRTTSLMIHVTKILLKIILYKNNTAINWEISKNYNGFMEKKAYQ